MATTASRLEQGKLGRDPASPQFLEPAVILTTSGKLGRTSRISPLGLPTYHMLFILPSLYDAYGPLNPHQDPGEIVSSAPIIATPLATWKLKKRFKNSYNNHKHTEFSKMSFNEVYVYYTIDTHSVKSYHS